MLGTSLVALGLIATSNALIRFSCSQLVVERLDPLVNPGLTPSPHLHQIVGGNSFNASMYPEDLDIPSAATCTTCTFTEDFSNYWTAVLYFRARNGTYKRVPQTPNDGFAGARGGMTVYYMQDALWDFAQASSVTAFQPGFRMFTGHLDAKTPEEAKKSRQMTFTCLQNVDTRAPETPGFPTTPCPAGIMANVRFPTCWDGVNLDTPDHMSHMAYPANGTFESQGPCPASHPVRMAQVLYETIWDTTQFNDPADWPEDGSQPFVWSFGDRTGYGTHADYVFGWKGDALQRVLNSPCFVNCPTLQTQTIEEANNCSKSATVNEPIDGCKLHVSRAHLPAWKPDGQLGNLLKDITWNDRE
ncbi:hypothetical protein LSUE1_G002377 [Lachnellula suecica]|uniref:DUF1996 domain-containing protein n=1 Tax=Lachnellula suecica TaxID=602035 RepID=A0A8T9CBR2_9HELO|nr:hypothetical protein LSUE1_G002377 [Lachnellula suecica]